MSKFQIPGATVKMVNMSTVKARPLSKAEMKEREAIDQSWKEATQKREAEYHRRAGGRKILRKFNPCGSCFKEGIVLRETAKFFVYALDAHSQDGALESFPQRKASKKRYHIEPCLNCEDHPNTHYPMGSGN